MAKDAVTEDKKPRSPLLMNVIVSSILGFACGGLGFAFCTVMPGIAKPSSAEEVSAKNLPPAFVPFGEVVVNIPDARMSRYLRVNFTLQVHGTDEEKVTADVELHRAILRNWVLGYLSDLQLEDIRGNVGQNRIRREIQNYFNEQLSPDGLDVVQDVLFEEFQIQ